MRRSTRMGILIYGTWQCVCLLIAGCGATIHRPAPAFDPASPLAQEAPSAPSPPSGTLGQPDPTLAAAASPDGAAGDDDPAPREKAGTGTAEEPRDAAMPAGHVMPSGVQMPAPKPPGRRLKRSNTPEATTPPPMDPNMPGMKMPAPSVEGGKRP